MQYKPEAEVFRIQDRSGLLELHQILINRMDSNVSSSRISVLTSTTCSSSTVLFDNSTFSESNFLSGASLDECTNPNGYTEDLQTTELFNVPIFQKFESKTIETPKAQFFH